MSGAGLYLPLILIAFAVILLMALRDDAPEIPERAQREPDLDFGPGGWMARIPREFVAPPYLTFPDQGPTDHEGWADFLDLANESPGEANRQGS